MSLSAIVLTRNEEGNISDCLKTLSGADEILVVDSGSTDRTVELAEQAGARVLHHPFENFSDQRNYAAAQARCEWILFIDADERVTPDLAEEIMNSISAGQASAVYAIPRATYFFGKPLHYGDAREDAPLRLFPRGHASWVQPVHEMLKTDLSCRRLNSKLLHFSTRDISHYQKKIKDYVPLELETMRRKRIRPGLFPVLWRPLAKFFFLYFWKFGFLDGITGLQYALLSAYYTAVKYFGYWKGSKGDCRAK